MITFGSVCSGIEGASVAWLPLGWTCAWVAEIEPFPSAVLAHHHPEVPNLGDMTVIPDLIGLGMASAPDVLVGGTPCQSFSLAGLRKGLHDARGQLTYSFVEIANAIDEQRPGDECVVLWENVPGVLSDKTNAFGCLLAGLVGETEPLVAPGKRWSDAGYVSGPQRSAAWIILDAQFFGLAQRRRRVFVVASARAGFDPFEVLFKWDGVRRDIAPSRDAGEKVTGTIGARTTAGGELGTDLDLDGGLQVAHILKADGFDASEDGTGRGTPLVPCFWNGEQVTQTLDAVLQKGQKGQTMPEKNRFPAVLIPFDTTQITSPDNYSSPADGDACHPLAATAHVPAVAFQASDFANYSFEQEDVARPLSTSADRTRAAPIVATMQVRRLTPRECERLQGFPDEWTLVPYRNKPAADGPRYKALGNSFAVPCISWIGKRIAQGLQ